MTSQSSTRFEDFVRELEAEMTEDESAELDAWRDHFRGDGPAGVREPVRS